MIIFLQFTLTDIRLFNEASTEVLDKPGWPLPNLSQFVRGTGKIRPRRKKGLKSWVHEGYLCEIRRGIGCPNITVRSGMQLKNVYRNFYSGEELVLNRYEFVFRTNLGKKTISRHDINETVSNILDSQVKIRIGENRYSPQLLSLAKWLKKFHRTNTTFKSKLSDTGTENSIMDCEPQIYLLLDDEEKLEKSGLEMDEIRHEEDGYLLFSEWHNYREKTFKLWVHERMEGSEQVVHRNLRITIQRIFSEQCCLKNVLHSISKGKISTIKGNLQSEKLQNYFNTAIRTYLRDEKKLISDNGMIDFADHFSKLFGNFQPGDLELLRQKIMNSEFRPAVEQKTEIFMSKYSMPNAQIGAVGDNAIANNPIFNQQSSTLPENTDYTILADELRKLREFLTSEAKTEEEVTAVKNIALAQAAAEEKNGSNLIKYLNVAGKFAIDTVQKLGVTVLAAFIKDNM
ncbi:hypothetical protein [Pedobacter sp. R-06]|uniref:hypothetical protein n=1 Tax=Pedobacter sp. R-06 TaxID=3404051 RepID=UPI003CE6D5E5